MFVPLVIYLILFQKYHDIFHILTGKKFDGEFETFTKTMKNNLKINDFPVFIK